jgi:hypothetical protein
MAPRPSGWVTVLVVAAVATLAISIAIIVIGGITLGNTSDIEKDVSKIKKATATSDVADSIQSMVDELGSRMETLDSRSSLHAVASQCRRCATETILSRSAEPPGSGVDIGKNNGNNERRRSGKSE